MKERKPVMFKKLFIIRLLLSFTLLGIFFIVANDNKESKEEI
ncbi:MAG: hypothetical protein PUB39_00180 [Eubacteriales bacterium]|nr:hypothetical protein [Eubacteriales bacterium]